MQNRRLDHLPIPWSVRYILQLEEREKAAGPGHSESVIHVSFIGCLEKNAVGTWTDEEAPRVLIMSEHVKFDRRQ